MRFFVDVRPNAARERVDVGADGRLSVAVRAPALQGKANAALVDLLAKHFGVGRSRVRILRGVSSRHKVVDIAE